MRIAVGQISQESHSFAPASISIQNFKDYVFLEGDEIPQRLENTNTTIAGFMDVMQRENFDPVYTLVAKAVSSGPLKREALDFLIGNLLEKLEKVGRVDGIYLALHGAMLVGETGDASGQILQVVRDKVGKNIPIVASLDLHARLTPLMVECTDALVAWHTFPHVDFKETGGKATGILTQIIKGEVIPEMAFCKIPMIVSAENAYTDREPAIRLIQKIKEIETQPKVVSASFFHVQPWLDVPNVGCATLVVTNNDKKLAKEKAKEFADIFWSIRYDLEPKLTPLKEAIQKAMDSKEGPIILLDSADGTSSGSAGDSVAALEAFLDMKVDKPAYTTVVDPEVVDIAIKAGVGKTISVSIGGKIDKRFSYPIKITAKVKTVSDGVFKYQGPAFHGVEVCMGQTVVLVTGKIYIVVMELPVIAWDPSLYRSVGLEPKDARIVVVKSPVSFYGDIAKELIFVDTPGPSTAHLTNLPYKNITRPLYPFDDIKDYKCKEEL